MVQKNKKKVTATNRRSLREGAGANTHKTGLKSNPTQKDLAEAEDDDIFEDEDMDLDAFEEGEDEEFDDENMDDMDLDEEEGDEDMDSDDDFEDEDMDLEEEEGDDEDFTDFDLEEEEDGDGDFDDMDDVLDEALVGEPGETPETELDEEEDDNMDAIMAEARKYKKALVRLAENHVRLQAKLRSNKFDAFKASKAAAVMAHLPEGVTRKTKATLVTKFDHCKTVAQVNKLVENVVRSIKHANNINAKKARTTKKVSVKESVSMGKPKATKKVDLQEGRVAGAKKPSQTNSNGKKVLSYEQKRINTLAGLTDDMYMQRKK